MAQALMKRSDQSGHGALGARRTQQRSQITFKGMQTILETEAPHSHCRSTAAAAVVVAAMTQWPAQAARACRKHRAYWETKLRMLLEPEEGDSKSCAVSVAI
ncbi:uncharacterized protein [Dermacentor andersoni]|uniref:uncharacterized protein n=1 Tax=Dermacentor andersoni TaxID=34620 RepID=UPI003B3A5D0F